MMRFLRSWSALILCFALSCGLAAAEELKIVFTGQTYAMLYPCSCPSSPAGGVARRAGVISEMRAQTKNLCVVEAGLSFASGEKDLYSQDPKTDENRTSVYLDALKAMDYDALLVSGQEYAFGAEFLKRRRDLPFVSSNIEKFSTPFILKDLGWIKVGILGLTDVSVKAKGVRGWKAPSSVLNERISQLKAKGAGLIVLLSSLSRQEEEGELVDVRGIDVIINGRESLGSVKLSQLYDALYLTTWWESRQIGVLTLEVRDRKIINSRLDAVFLGPDQPDDKKVSLLLPACFSDGNCGKKEMVKGRCENAGTKAAQCVYPGLSEVSLTVIRPRDCSLCSTEGVVKDFKELFRGESLTLREIGEDDARAQGLIKEFGITMLPAYLFGKEVEASKHFGDLKGVLLKGADLYYLAPSSSGVSYLLGRPRIPKKLDVFFTMDDKDLDEIFELLKTFKVKHPEIGVAIHFIASTDGKGVVVSKNGAYEVEEFARAACVAEKAPDKLLDYLLCRVRRKPVEWREMCAADVRVNPQAVSQCVASAKGQAALRDRIRLSEELGIENGPTFIVDNTEIFSTVHAPTIEEFEKAVVRGDKTAGQQEKKDTPIPGESL